MRLAGRLVELRRRLASGRSAEAAAATREPSSAPSGDLASPSALRVEPHPEATNPVLAREDVDDVDDVSFVADPFVVHDGERYHLFFEIKSRTPRWFGLRGTTGRFDIGHATSLDGLDWTYRGVVIPAEQGEYTYPFVFRHDGDWLMTPSPAGSSPREFRVYRASAFPDEWTLVDRALSGHVRIDPTPFAYEGTWYLPYQEAGTFDVRLRYADTLVGGDWREHPASPLFTPGGNDIAQGGRPLVHDDCVDLFFRRGTPGLVEYWRLAELSPTSLRMRELPESPVVSGTGSDGWNGRNMHHIDAGPTRDGSDAVLVDGQDREHEYRLGVYRQSRPR
jgi:hypothetical protein